MNKCILFILFAGFSCIAKGNTVTGLNNYPGVGSIPIIVAKTSRGSLVYAASAQENTPGPVGVASFNFQVQDNDSNISDETCCLSDNTEGALVELKDSSVSIKITFSDLSTALPIWIERACYCDGGHAEWDSFYNSVHKHEDGHHEDNADFFKNDAESKFFKNADFLVKTGCKKKSQLQEEKKAAIRNLANRLSIVRSFMLTEIAARTTIYHAKVGFYAPTIDAGKCTGSNCD